MGNGILLANTVLLSYTNFKTFGKMYSQGAKNAARVAAGQSKRDLTKRVTLQEGKYAFEDITKKEAVLKGLQTGAREGLEEMNQAWISETMGNYKSPDSPDAYYRAMLDEDANI
jgi:purine nucleoside permease